jgi:PHD finger-like domain-containing protein 5A
MAKHHPDLIMCRKLPGIAIGRLCEKCAQRALAWLCGCASD